MSYPFFKLPNKFLRLSKSLFNAFILFAPKLNKGLQFCIDYQSLKNLTIKNSYLFSLVSKSLNTLGQAKRFTKLNFTNAYN